MQVRAQSHGGRGLRAAVCCIANSAPTTGHHNVGMLVVLNHLSACALTYSMRNLQYGRSYIKEAGAFEVLNMDQAVIHSAISSLSLSIEGVPTVLVCSTELLHLPLRGASPLRAEDTPIFHESFPVYLPAHITLGSSLSKHPEPKSRPQNLGQIAQA